MTYKAERRAVSAYAIKSLTYRLPMNMRKILLNFFDLLSHYCDRTLHTIIMGVIKEYA